MKGVAFQRSAEQTVLGYAHVIIGFASTVSAVARIYFFGAEAVFRHGTLIGLFNYFHEFSAILLWVSGIGLLRGRKFGHRFARIWAVATILSYLGSRVIYNIYWGKLAPAPTWGELVLILYCILLLARETFRRRRQQLA